VDNPNNYPKDSYITQDGDMGEEATVEYWSARIIQKPDDLECIQSLQDYVDARTGPDGKVYPLIWAALADKLQLDAYVILIQHDFNFADYGKASGIEDKINQANRIISAQRAATLFVECFPGETSSPSPKARRF